MSEKETRSIHAEPPFVVGYEKDVQEMEQLRESTHLKGLNRQKLFVLERNLFPMPCPLCLHCFGAMDAEVSCPNCGIGVHRLMPFVMQPGTPGWRWSLAKTAREALLRLWNQREGNRD